MFKMDLTGLNHSPTPSDKGGGWSWPIWGSDNSTETNTELCGLVEDKEIAARAVAFVVNSTRKGIVPLCADVANLLRTKQSLEKKVQQLKRENHALRSSASLSYRPSDSTSPTPASLSSTNSYTETCIKALQEAQERYNNRSSSRCSNCSSTLSYSPKIDKSHDRMSGMQYSFGSHRENHKQDSSKSTYEFQSGFPEVKELLAKGHAQLSPFLLCKTADLAVDEAIYLDDEILPNDGAFEGDMVEMKNVKSMSLEDSNKNSFKTTVDIHNYDGAGITFTEKVDIINEGQQFSFHIENENSSSAGASMKVDDLDKQKLESDKFETVENFALEYIGNNSVSNTEVDRKEIQHNTRRRSLPEVIATPSPTAYKVHAKISKQIQCSLGQQSNDTLEGQFLKTVKTNSKLMEELGLAQKEIEVLRQRLKQIETEGAHRRHEHGDGLYPMNDDGNLEDNGYYTSSNKTTRHSSVNKKSSPKRVSATGVSYAGPIPSCKCSSCKEDLGSDDDLSHYSDHLMDEPQRYAVNSKLLVQLDDHVVVKGDKSGTICYIGHIDKSRQSSILYVGLELDTPTGKHDGYYQGKRYFFCGKDRGLFVPLQDVICKGNKMSKTAKQELSIPSSSRSRKSHKKGQSSSDEDPKITEL